MPNGPTGQETASGRATVPFHPVGGFFGIWKWKPSSRMCWPGSRAISECLSERNFQCQPAQRIALTAPRQLTVGGHLPSQSNA